MTKHLMIVAAVAVAIPDLAVAGEKQQKVTLDVYGAF